jgi:hypothetical protein
MSGRHKALTNVIKFMAPAAADDSFVFLLYFLVTFNRTADVSIPDNWWLHSIIYYIHFQLTA